MEKSKVIEENLKMHEKEAENYEEEKTEIYNEEEQKRIKSVLKEVEEYIETGNSNRRVLDIGCGTGNLLEKLLSRFDNVIGIDLSGDMLSSASSKLEGNDNLKLVRGEVSSLPFKDDYFDMVSAYSLLHHLPSFSDPVSEISRVLRDGGVLYVDHEPTNREDILVKSYIKFCEILNGETYEGFPPYKEEEGREYCDYQIHHGKDGGIPTSKITDLCEEEGLKIITTRKYLSCKTDGENLFRPLFKHFIDNEWLLIGKKKV